MTEVIISRIYKLKKHIHFHESGEIRSIARDVLSGELPDAPSFRCIEFTIQYRVFMKGQFPALTD